MHTLNKWLIALLVCLAVGGSHLLDGPSDIEAAEHQEQSVADAQKYAQKLHDVEQSAAEFCKCSKGSGYVHRWTLYGEVVCIKEGSDL